MSEETPAPFVTDVSTHEGWERDEETGGLVRIVRTEPVLVGLWKPNGVAGQSIEFKLDAHETLVVLEGSGELWVDDGAPIELRPGVVVSLSRGAQVRWRVDENFRELWIYC
jgi:uncharacterized cupin superfamily protein